MATAAEFGLRLVWAPIASGGRYWLDDDGTVTREIDEEARPHDTRTGSALHRTQSQGQRRPLFGRRHARRILCLDAGSAARGEGAGALARRAILHALRRAAPRVLRDDGADRQDAGGTAGRRGRARLRHDPGARDLSRRATVSSAIRWPTISGCSDRPVPRWRTRRWPSRGAGWRWRASIATAGPASALRSRPTRIRSTCSPRCASRRSWPRSPIGTTRRRQRQTSSRRAISPARKALGRPDLGRIAAGAKADIVIVDPTNARVRRQSRSDPRARAPRRAGECRYRHGRRPHSRRGRTSHDGGSGRDPRRSRRVEREGLGRRTRTMIPASAASTQAFPPALRRLAGGLTHDRRTALKQEPLATARAEPLVRFSGVHKSYDGRASS